MVITNSNTNQINIIKYFNSIFFNFMIIVEVLDGLLDICNSNASWITYYLSVFCTHPVYFKVFPCLFLIKFHYYLSQKKKKKKKITDMCVLTFHIKFQLTAEYVRIGFPQTKKERSLKVYKRMDLLNDSSDSQHQ